MQKSKWSSAALIAALLLSGCASNTQTRSDVATSSGPSLAPPRQSAALNTVNPQDLIGKGPRALRSLLGAPTLLRRDHGAEMWQYAGRSCVLLAYLYPNAKGEAQISYLDARAKTSGAVPVGECLGALSRDRAAAPTS